jgi:hypothetical protein
VERLRDKHHDVVWIPEANVGETDIDILKRSVTSSRVVLTADWDFGELVIRFRNPAYGVVIVAISQFAGDLEAFSEGLAHRLTDLGESLIGKLTIIDAARVRQRDLNSADQT